MHQWAKDSTYYHIVIDRFATGRQEFNFSPTTSYSQQLREWMGGNISGITQSLDYLEYLGIGVLLLSPFFRGKKYHGYWVTDFMQVDPHIGTLQQLRELIESAHKRNIRVIMDLPVTHCHINCPLVQQAISENDSGFHDWFLYNHNGNFQGFFGDADLPEFNLEFPPVVNYLKKVIRYWLELGIDGIRFDHAKRPGPPFWLQITSYLRDLFPQVFLLGENWHESGSIGSLSPYLDAELNIPLSLEMRELIQKPEKTTIKQIIQSLQLQQNHQQRGYLLPTFLDNHDMERICLLASDNQPLIALAFLLQLTLPYPPIIYCGSERAQSQTHNLAKDSYERDRYFREPMNWQQGDKMAAWVRKIISFRNEHIDWFTSNPPVMQVYGNSTLAYSYHRAKITLTIVINFSEIQNEIILHSSPESTWLVDDVAIQNISTNKVHKLEAYNAAIFKTVHKKHKQHMGQKSSWQLSSQPLVYD